MPTTTLANEHPFQCVNGIGTSRKLKLQVDYFIKRYEDKTSLEHNGIWSFSSLILHQAFNSPHAFWRYVKMCYEDPTTLLLTDLLPAFRVNCSHQSVLKFHNVSCQAITYTNPAHTPEVKSGSEIRHACKIQMNLINEPTYTYWQFETAGKSSNMETVASANSAILFIAGQKLGL